MPSAQAQRVLALVGIAATAAYALLPVGLSADVLYAAMAWTPVAALALGLRWHRPSRPQPWQLLIAGLSLNAAADALSALHRHGERSGHPPGAEASGTLAVLYLVVFAVFITALLLLGHPWRTGGDTRQGHRRGGVLDAAILATGLGLLVWTFVLRPALAGSVLDGYGQTVGAAYCLGAVLLMALLLRRITGSGRREPAYWLMVGAAVACLSATVGFQALALHGQHSRWVGATLIAGFTLLGLAALHPTMRAFSDAPRAARAETPPTRGRIAVLGAAALVAPGLQTTELLLDREYVDWASVAGSAAMALLVVARLDDLLGQVRSQARQLTVLADTDALTGVANRRRWDRELARELARANRHGGTVTVAVLDLDHFKGYNDSFGHPAGDEALRRAVIGWQARLRAGDVLARLGGEEFAVLLPACELPAALALADELRMSTPAGLTTSVGVAGSAPGEAAKALLGRADAALYAAKHRGRDRVVAAPAAGHSPVRALQSPPVPPR